MRRCAPISVERFVDRLEAGVAGEGYLEGTIEREASYMRAGTYRFRAVLDLLPETLAAGTRLLDVGATPFTIYLKHRFAEAEVHALDKTDLLAARFEAEGVRLSTCDLQNEPLPYGEGEFDAIVFTEVLEHLFRRPTDVLADMRRVLRPGGVLIVSVPNIASLRKRIAMLAGRSPLEDLDGVIKDWMHGFGHVREYTMAELQRALVRAGLEVEAARSVNSGPRDVWGIPAMAARRRLAKAAYCWVAGRLPNTGSCLIARARKPA